MSFVKERKKESMNLSGGNGESDSLPLAPNPILPTKEINND